MKQPLTIEAAHQLNIKTQTKILLGKIASIAFHRRFSQLAANPVGRPTGFIDKALMRYLKQEAIRTDDVKFLDLLHKDYWQGSGGQLFSSKFEYRFEDLFLARQGEDFLALQNLWNQSGVNQIVEFGCNSGLLLQFLTQQLAGVRTATGIELNQHQVDENLASKTFDTRVNFACADAGEWLFDNGQSHTLFVTNGGVMEYFRRERLNQMLQFISDELKPAMFFSVEPFAADHNWSTATESIPFGEELSFSHNYKDLFLSNGFEIVHQRLITYKKWCMAAIVAISQ